MPASKQTPVCGAGSSRSLGRRVRHLWGVCQKNKASTRIKMTAEERRMAKNECEARRREKLKKAAGEPEIIDPMPKMAKGMAAIKEFPQKIN